MALAVLGTTVGYKAIKAAYSIFDSQFKILFVACEQKNYLIESLDISKQILYTLREYQKFFKILLYNS